MLDVRDLQMYFPLRSGVMRRTTRHIKAVDGVSFSVVPHAQNAGRWTEVTPA